MNNETVLPIVNIKLFEHRKKNVMGFFFGYNVSFSSIVRQLKYPRWSQSNKCWYVENTAENVKDVYRLFSGIAKIVIEKPVEIYQEKSEKISLGALSSEVIKKLLKFKYWMRSRRYSDNTIKTYAAAIEMFLKYNSNKSVDEINNEDLIIFNNEYILKNNLSASYQNQIVNAIKLFFRKIENTSIDVELIHRPKRAKLLPNVLSKAEVKQILNAHNNLKHKAMLAMLYGCGLRCGELLRLKPENVDSKRNVLIIKQSKGRKDRIAPLSVKIVEMLREYFIASKPSVYLFEGHNKGEPYDERSLQQVLKQALEKVGIKKPVSLHWLRHSYATHLLEGGTDLRYIQEILGHSSSKTTEIYTHVSTKNIQQIVSPFDYL